MMVGKMPSGDLMAKERLETQGWLAAIASEKKRKETEISASCRKREESRERSFDS